MQLMMLVIRRLYSELPSRRRKSHSCVLHSKRLINIVSWSVFLNVLYDSMYFFKSLNLSFARSKTSSSLQTANRNQSSPI